MPHLDHRTIIWSYGLQKIFIEIITIIIRVSSGRYPQSALNSFGLWSSRNEWFSKLEPSPSSNELALSFTNDLNTAIDNFFPVKTIRFHPTDKPWITDYINKRQRQLIKKRQRAFHTGDVHLWRQYRRSIQKEIRSRKNNFYAQKIHDMQKDDIHQWWHIISTMSGRT